MQHPRPFLCLALIFLAGASNASFPTLYLKPLVLQQFHSPTNITHAPDGSGRLFVCDQPGQVLVFQNGQLLPQPFIDISSKMVPVSTTYSETGLLGMAFHPGFADPASPGHRKLYLYYSAPAGTATPNPSTPQQNVSVLSEFQVSASDPNSAPLSSERILLTFGQPQSNHNGGQIEFGPDGMLYLASGDGGGANDNARGHTGTEGSTSSLGNAQDRSNLLGKILRIDPADPDGPGPQSYSIPPDNPFFSDPAPGVRKEIYAYGLRNPWRFSFDTGPGGTQRLYCCDVGQNRIEEVNLIIPGGNYGWRYFEGTEMPVFSSGSPSNPMPHPGGVLIPPIAQYAHPGATGSPLPQLGISGTGGYVYRGSAIPSLRGKYVFGDYGATSGAPGGRLMGLEEVPPGSGSFVLTPAIPLVGGNPFSLRVLCLGQDASGELYVGTKTSGGVKALENGLPNGGLYQLVPADAVPPPLILEPVRDTSLFSETGPADADLSNGGPPLFAGQTPDSRIRRALLAFDLSGIPAAARFESAILRMSVIQASGDTSGLRLTTLNRVLSPWGEAATSDLAGGVTALPGDATWNQRLFSASSPLFWVNPGGDFSLQTSSSTAIRSAGPFALQGAQMVNDVHLWLSDPASNHGWILRSDETLPGRDKSFASRESPAAQRPTLTLVPLTHYDAYLATHYRDLDPAADDDGDGIANQIEYAFGLSPVNFDQSDGFSVSSGPLLDGARTVTITFRRDINATDLTYQLQLGTGLPAWTTIAEVIQGAPAAGLHGALVESETPLSASIRLVTVSIPLQGAGAERHFFRLNVTRQP